MIRLALRRDALLRSYKVLLCASLVLITVHISRHLPSGFAGGNPLLANSAPLAGKETASVGGPPHISWGGQRR